MKTYIFSQIIRYRDINHNFRRIIHAVMPIAIRPFDAADVLWKNSRAHGLSIQ